MTRSHHAGARAHLLLLLLLLLVPVRGGAAPPRGGEVRAVWVTTLLGLDWPKTTDAAEQQRSLRAMVRSLAADGYNTIFFQVRGRGDAMYRSRFEPWSSQLTGTLGRDPGWDPLALIVEEAHANGMELHAWFNTVKVGAVTAPRDGGPLVTDRHPAWSHDADGERWLDPGLPAVRAYLVDVALDLVRGYDLDGLQLDFIRYPAGAFDDAATYRRYGAGAPKEEWRRANVTRIVAALRDSLARVRPTLKLGAAPLGIYRNTPETRGLAAYDETYQASRDWLERGLVDYLAPQVYWSLGDRPGNPDFARVAADWAAHAAGRQVIIGIAPYKPEVLAQLGAVIDAARATGAAGHAFFRYSNVAGVPVVAGRYGGPALPPPMPWKSEGEPPALALVRQEAAEGGGVALRWAEVPARGVRAAVYRGLRPGLPPTELVALLPARAGAYLDPAARGGSAELAYAVSLLDRGGNEGLPVAARAAASAATASAVRLAAPLRDAEPGTLFVPYELLASGRVTVRIEDARRQTVAGIVDEVLDAGRYVAAASVGGLPPGRYTLVAVTGSRREERAFELR